MAGRRNHMDLPEIVCYEAEQCDAQHNASAPTATKGQRDVR
jgi:hypothetical protein